MDVARSETVEADLDRFIRRRSTRKPDPDEREELWKASVAAYNARRQEENRVAWVGYFSHLAGALRARAEDYERRAALLEDQGEGVRS